MISGKLNRILIVFCLLLLKSYALIAQGPGFPPTPGGGVPGQEGIPVDGGITILAAAGIGFGVKKLRDARKNKQATCRQSGK